MRPNGRLLLLIAVVTAGLAAPAVAQNATVEALVQALTPPDTLGIAVVAHNSEVLEAKVQMAAPEDVYSGITDSRLPTLDLEVNFAFNSSELTAATKSSLALLAKAMQDERLLQYRFVVGGHTDTKGAFEYNDRLSILRAEETMKYLVLQGTDPDRLVITGFGERFPKVADGEAAVNRRVQFVTIK